MGERRTHSFPMRCQIQRDYGSRLSRFPNGYASTGLSPDQSLDEEPEHVASTTAASTTASTTTTSFTGTDGREPSAAAAVAAVVGGGGGYRGESLLSGFTGNGPEIRGE
ncbi:hypothetical protein NHX12_003316 [Muraenolepis orangiensis]|uniref:Uncharacterized protein n=1 Tax=Muraenolepis orangiensis TaxID=630683 RepID=A0A9Q0DYJ3_9TELE|nr:hypothetical protein NHX12_003316 [Muraenolepis orangiensis]